MTDDERKQRRNASKRKWEASHPDKAKESRRKWAAANPEKVQEKNRKWQSANPDKMRASLRKYQVSHREEAREYARKYRDENLEIVKERTRKWKAENPEKNHELYRQWREANPEKKRAIDLRRRARKSNTVVSLTAEQIEEKLRAGCFFADETCSGPLAIAHDIPVKHLGNTTWANTFCLCQKHNSQMGTKTLAQKIKQLLFPF